MPPQTQAKALKNLASILTDTLRILSDEIHYHSSIPPGSTRYCNHSDTEFHFLYHQSMRDGLSDLRKTTQGTLDAVDESIQALPHNIWTDPIEGPILRYKITCHEGIEFEHYGSEHWTSDEP
jgi:hypothetical protein